MRKKHAPTEVLIFFLKLFTKKSLEKNLKTVKTVTLHYYCGVKVKYEFLSETLLMKATLFSLLLLLADCELFQLGESKKTYSTLWSI